MNFRKKMVCAVVGAGFAAASFTASAVTLRIGNQGDALSMEFHAVSKMPECGGSVLPFFAPTAKKTAKPRPCCTSGSHGPGACSSWCCRMQRWRRWSAGWDPRR